MSSTQIADVMAFLAQGMSIKDAALTAGVSEWSVANLIGPCRKVRR